MNTTITIVATAIALPLAVLSIWAWIAVRRLQKALSIGFEGIHFEP